MNGLIRELAIQSGLNAPYGNDHEGLRDFDYRKFAKLVVRETLNEMGEQMDKFGDDQSNNPTWYKAMEAVEKHFGVKE
jgi:hypothetical protein